MGLDPGVPARVGSETAPSPRDPFLLIPAYNEAPSLPALLDEIRRLPERFCVVVIDDGSSDGTARCAEDHGARVLRHPFNLGYGAALQTGYKYALAHGAPFVVQMDADGQHPPEEIRALLDSVRRGECDLALGSRFLGKEGYRAGFLRSAGRVLLRALARLGRLEITDPTSGFQAMNRTALELFSSELYPSDYPDVDVLLLAHRSGLRIREKAVRMAPGWRESSLHSGWKPVYYAYKMLLSLWTISRLPRARESRPEDPRP